MRLKDFPQTYNKVPGVSEGSPAAPRPPARAEQQALALAGQHCLGDVGFADLTLLPGPRLTPRMSKTNGAALPPPPFMGGLEDDLLVFL